MSVIAATKSGAETSLCSICAGIDARRPYCGPECSQVGSGTATRLVYEHATSLTELERAARRDECHLCQLLFDVIREYSEHVADSKNVVDDWEHVDMLYDELGELEHEIVVPEQILQRYQAFFEKPSATIEDILDADAPILLDLTFRAPMRDELASRCTDVAVHWTHNDGSRRMTSSLSLVSGLSGTYLEGCQNICNC